MKVTKCNNADCSGGNVIVSTLDDPANVVGTSTSIAIGADGWPIISYFDETALSLKVAKCNDPSCAGNNETITTVDNTGGRSSIAIGKDDLPVISYFDLANGRLKAMKCNDVACSGAEETISVVDDPEDEVGQFNSIVIGGDEMPIIAYYDSSVGALKVANCNDAACSGQDETISTIDGPLGAANSLQYIHWL